MPRGLSACDFYERGLALKKVQIFDMAITEFREAAKDPEQAGKAFAQMALCLKRLGRDQEAVAALYEALARESFSHIARVHMQYLLAQMLESLDRASEALVVYRTIRREHPNFQDVGDRIQDLSTRKVAARAHQGRDGTKLWSYVKPQLTSVINQSWQRLAHYGDMLDACRPGAKMSLPGQERADVEIRASGPSEPSVSAQEALERRHQGRVAVQMLSQFFAKAHTVAGEGEVRDLSPSGCRITSPVRVTPGTAVECWIYPQDGHPFAVDEATVQWVGHREFGLRFTNVRFGVQRQITDMC